jgi:UPF0271 protein
MGDAAWRFALPAGTDPAAALDALKRIPRVIDVVVADGIALVTFDPSRPPEDPRPHLSALAPRDESARTHHVIRVRYDGVDLEDVARQCGLSIAEVITLHSSREYTVELVGFLPGFAYLGSVDARIAVPRRPSPRTRVPASAVGLAAGRTAVYPFTTPGGWNLIGTAIDFRALTPDSGVVLQLGDRVRFEPVS